MLKLAKYCCCSFSLVLMLFCTQLTAQPSIALSSGNWPPYTQNVSDNEGVATDVVRAVFKRMSRTIDIQWQPWARGEEQLKQGNIFATFPYAITPERREQYHFSDTLLESRGNIFYLKERTDIIDINNIDDLKDVSIGGIRGYHYVPSMNKAGAKLHLVNNNKQLVQLLLRKRIDYAFMNQYTGWLTIQELDENLKQKFSSLAPDLYKAQRLALMISKQYPHYVQLTEEFNKALNALKNSGEIEKIKHNYFNLAPRSQFKSLKKPFTE